MPVIDPRLAYDALPVMIRTAGADGRCDYVNQRWLEFTGRGSEAELGLGWATRVHPEDRDACLERGLESLAARRPFLLEYRLQRFDGEYRWLLDTSAPRSGTEGFLGYISCCTDITERRILEQRLAQAERTEAIGLLAGGIAHDFNNLLTGIIGHVALLQEEPNLSAEARDDLGQIQAAADRAASLTRQLLAFGRRQVFAPRILDLNQVVSGTLSALRRMLGSRIELVQTLDADVDPVLADPGQIEQILLQLSANARESMPDGGRLEMITRRVTLDQLAADRLPAMRAGPYTALLVRDTGGGLEPPMSEAAVPEFASVHGIVKQSGGYMDVASDPGLGTTVTIYLPPYGGSEAAGTPLPRRRALGGTETILVVEDQEQVRDLARRVLERSGYTVLTAADAEAAMAIADRHPGHIHLLVTDPVLPRTSGRELAARLGIHRPAIKVLYISGTSDGAIARHRLLEPGTELLEKPFTLESLLRKARQVLGETEGGGRPA